MIVSALQNDIIWCEKEKNFESFGKLLAAAPASDLYVLPEMFSTGFATEPQGVAEEEPSVSLGWMKKWAAELGGAVAGSVSLKAADGTYRNRFFFVKPDGSYQYYDKRHLFTYGGEHHRYTSGNERVIVEYKGVRFLLTVCYDLRFPMWCRNRDEYDVMLSVASWPKPRAEAWKTLQKARAIENQCYVVAVNRVGNDPYCVYQGDTMIIDPYGVPSASCAAGKVGTATARLDMDALKAFREKFPVLKDTVLYKDWNENF